MTQKTLRSDAYYIDTFAHGSQHEMFNTSLILMCSLIFDNVKCNISKSSFRAFKGVTNNSIPSSISFNYIRVVDGKSRFHLLFRYLVSAVQNLRYLIVSPKNSIIIFPFNNLFSLRILNLVNKFLKRKIIIFCHGEMEGLIKDLERKGALHSILIKLAKDFFQNAKIEVSKTIYFSVLGDILKRNLAGVVTEDKISKFTSIDHPYIFKEVINSSNRESGLIHKSNSTNIGTVGTLTKAKGIDAFMKFINELPPSVRQNINISVIGQISGGSILLRKLGVNLKLDNKLLSRSDYNDKVKKLDIILFFYPSNSYKITASAAIYDAILHEKPVLALKNDYFSYLFEKLDSFGYLCDNVAEMSIKLNELVKDKDQIKIDFANLKKKLTPERVSTQLKFELIRIGHLPK